MTYDLFPGDPAVAADVAPSASPSVLYVREAAGQYRKASVDEILGAATSVLEQRLLRSRVAMTSPQVVKDYLVTRLGSLQHEVFGVVFLDSQHGVIAVEQLFRGTLSQTSVYPREVLKESLARNAAALILWHNHPSGSPEPSRADEFLTTTLKAALAFIDVRVLDHMIVAGNKVTSFAERGLM